MNRTAYLTASSLAILTAVIFVPTVFANTSVSVSNNGEGSSTKINIESNTGENKICDDNGCRTTSNNGTNKATVCDDNGCRTFEGNVDYQSEDGSTKVKLNTNNNSTSDVTVEKNESKNDDEVVKKKAAPTVTPDIIKEVEGIQDKLIAKKDTIKKEVEEKTGFDLFKFLEAEFESIKKLFTLEFLFNRE